LAGETGSEFPVFKTEGGAFDRAKFNADLQASMGANINQETADALKEANSVGDAAKKFFKGSFEQNLKALDPAYDPKSVFYREARSPSGIYQKSIQNQIDKGEAVDGKEIFEMSKKSAEKKLANVAILKTGKVTEILENVGFDDFKNFNGYEDVKSDFDSKIKEDKFKFDSVLDGFWLLLDDFNSKEAIPAQTLEYLNNPENSAMLSAIAKVLEFEGFNSESVLAMSKRYDESLAKLVEISEKGSVEGAKTPTEEKKTETPATATTEEQKVGEKKEEAKGGETGATPVEPAKTETTTTAGTTGEATTAPQGSTQETTLNKPAEEPKKVEGAAGGNTPATTTGPTSAETSSRIDSLISNLFGVKSGAGGTGAGEGGTGAGGTGAGTTGGAQSLENKLTASAPTSQEVSSAIDKNLESLGFKAKSSPGGTSTSTVENLSTKNETSSAPTGIKETETQKLSSVAPPAENKPTEETKTATTTPVNSETVTNKVSAETASVNSPTGNEQNKGEAPKESVSSTGNEDLNKKMETMVTLLTQLNNTMQGPLLVTSMSKKID
jgi:hypothetical protein